LLAARRPTLNDIARRAGVSKATVSLSLNGKGAINEETRRRVLTIAAELGYPIGVPGGGISMTIGIAYNAAIKRLENTEILSRIARSIQSAAANLGNTSIIYAPAIPGDFAWQNLINTDPDGIFFLSLDTADSAVQEVVAAGIPAILVNQHGGRGVSSVSADNERGMAMAAAHLLEEHGCRRFLYIQYDRPLSSFTRRLEGCRHALNTTTAGPAGASLYIMKYTKSVNEIFNDIMSKVQTAAIDAIICDRSHVATIVVNHLCREGVSIPEKLKVIGFDGIEAAKKSRLPLTVVDYDIQKLGEEAVSLLLRLVKGEVSEAQILLPCKLVRRASCGCAAI